MKATALACLTLIAALPLIGCGAAVEVADEPEFDCPSPGTVATVSDLNYTSDCDKATSAAVEHLDSGHYLRACGEANRGAQQPAAVESAHVTQCRPTEERGVFLDVEVCCPETEVVEQKPEIVRSADRPECPAWRTRARIRDLHYPDAESCDAPIRAAESDLGIAHYRDACKKAAPRATRPIKVLDARVVECRSGGGVAGFVVDVELCCDVKVYEEREFRDLVWNRPPEAVRAALGEPSKVTEWPQGTHWSFPLEVARDDRVFPEVTVVIVNNRVDSYYF